MLSRKRGRYSPAEKRGTVKKIAMSDENEENMSKKKRDKVQRIDGQTTALILSRKST